ncbi:MAG: M43 family zinc metalloprotease [Bacteroidia bacterium]|nr:M43 family zinc metalloprotease [Bacteroidia bacterium]
MKKISIVLLSTFGFYLSNAQETKQIIPCATYEAMEMAFQQDPEAKARYNVAQKELEEAYKNYEESLKLHQGKTAAFQYTIPVVFHVLHTNGPENISDAVLINALAQVNSDYARMGSDTGTIYSAFKSLYINSDIVFMLAHKDPSGNCTSGIVHYYNTNTNWVQLNFPYPYTWNPTKYLNIYIVKEICQSAPNCSTSGGIVVGYTYKPGTWSTGSSRDAIVYNYQFLTGTQARSLSHEIGHWLNLSHTFGNTNNPGVSCGDDGIADTPPTKGFFSTCPSSATGSGCASPENVENIMDYSSCPKMFTVGQTNAMRSALASSVSGRNNLSTSANLIATGVNDTSTCKPIAYGYPATFTTCTGSSLTVTDRSFNGPVASRTWAATGGATIANPSASVTTIVFSNAGVQTVSLTTCNFAGCTTYTFNVNVVNGTPNITASYLESFEGSTSLPANWSVINGSGGTTYQVYTGGGATGSNAMFIDGSLEPPGAEETLETPSYDFQNNSGAIFTFKYAYARKTSSHNDKLIVQASADCGGTWTNVYQPSASTMASGSGGTTSTPFYPTPSQFKTYTLTSNPAFTSFKTKPNVKIRFVFQEDATNGFGNNFFLDDINFSTTVGVNELTQSIGLSVSPNPTNSNFTIKFTLSDPAELNYQVTDILGKTILKSNKQTYQVGEHDIDVNISALPAGIYFLQLELNGQKIARKIIKE